MADSKPAAAPASGRLARLGAWIDERFPMTKLWNEHVGGILRAEELQLLVLLRLDRAVRARAADRHGHLPDDELQAVRHRGLRLGRIHHARRRVGLADPLPALDRRVGLLHRRLPAHVQGAALRVAPQAPRAAVDLRRADLPGADGRGFLRLPAALGQHVLLGRPGDRVVVRHLPADRRCAHRVDPRRLLHLGHHAEPVLRAARRRAAAGADIPRRRARARPARSRLEQPRRHRDQENEGGGRPPARRDTRFIPITP